MALTDRKAQDAQDLATIEQQFSYHKPKGDQPERYELLRAKAKELAQLVIQHVPPCADRTFALRQLRMAIMTANAAIAITEAGVDFSAT